MSYMVLVDKDILFKQGEVQLALHPSEEEIKLLQTEKILEEFDK